MLAQISLSSDSMKINQRNTNTRDDQKVLGPLCFVLPGKEI